MNIMKSLTFFSLNFLFTSASDFCSNSFCASTEPIIRFPFRLENHQPSSCGYPGLNLNCDAFNRTVIDLPNSGKFTVETIEYTTQNIFLNDPDHCLPRRLLELNLSTSPFNAFFYQAFTLFNCSLLFDYARYEFDPIGCLSGENYTVLASSAETAIRFLAARCSLIATVAVPVQWQFFEPVMSSDLGGDIRLTWSTPRCRRCESRGGRCGLRNVGGTEIECRNGVHHGLSRSARYVIVIGAGLPAFLFLICILYFLCNRVENYIMRPHPMMEFSVVVAPHSASILGLDGPTIESYPKTTLGESCRLPEPGNNICSICLSEYMPKETLRSIPECQHCFHVECIDEWLRLNRSCPICRNSPRP